MAHRDEDILRMLQEVETIEDVVDDLQDGGLPSMRLPEADACLHCGEPAENRGDCAICEVEGCLPPDLWSPGMADPCLTLCARCARAVHLGCAREDAAGNPTCPTCKW